MIFFQFQHKAHVKNTFHPEISLFLYFQDLDYEKCDFCDYILYKIMIDFSIIWTCHAIICFFLSLQLWDISFDSYDLIIYTNVLCTYRN
jgi:hypothetical protein